MLLGRSTGGIGTHVRDLVERLRDLGHEVQVVTDPLTLRRFELAGAHPWWPSPRSPVRAWRGLWRLRHLVRGAHVIHAHGHQAGLLAVLVTRGLSARPAVAVSHHNAVVHATGVSAPFLEAAQRLVARSADLVTGASSDLVQAARERGARWTELAPVPSPRVPGLLATPALGVSDRLAVAHALLRSHALPTSRPLLVTVSRVAPQKDLDVLLDSSARIATPVTWCVLGDGDAALGARLRAQVRRRGLPVHFVGAVADPTPWLRACEVFVLTSRWEARALVVQEALAAGAPVVCSDVGGLSDLVEGIGTLVPVGSAEGFAEAVERLLGDPGAREVAAAAGRHRARTWPDGDTTARRWSLWYARAVDMTYS